MSGNRRKSQGRRRSGGNQNPKPVDLWRPVPPLSDLEPIKPVADPTALVRSLGDPPLAGQDHTALQNIALIASRAAKRAEALAAATGLLALPDAVEDDSTRS
jgi:hypothetical protein